MEQSAPTVLLSLPQQAHNSRRTCTNWHVHSASAPHCAAGAPGSTGKIVALNGRSLSQPVSPFFVYRARPSRIKNGYVTTTLSVIVSATLLLFVKCLRAR